VPNAPRGLGWLAFLTLVVAGASPVAATPTPLPEPTVPFGRVIYRAAKVAGFESLGVTMIACRHRDPVPRRFAVHFFDRAGRQVSSFGVPWSPPTPAGKKVVFVTDGMHFHGDDILDIRLGHLAIGTARVVSDAEIVHCVGKIRMDGGARSPSSRDEIGLVRAGEPLPELGDGWGPPPQPSPRR
jgi:hypothetical protein